ncbi:MAG: YfcE family phosphodiesterase [Deltaproteobacteria bacterium]|nr:YfcE family phosphodiesterase [Deltaproteobacteria bacterium]
MPVIGVISDTHLDAATPDLMDALSAHLSDVTTILHAGDVTHPVVLDEIEAHGWRVLAVQGNMDLHPGLASLPQIRLLDFGGVRVGLCHGWGRSGDIRTRVLGRFNGDRPGIMVYGHTHQADDRVEAGVRFLNPGSPTDRRFAPFCSLGRLYIPSDGDLNQVRFEIVRL